MLPPETEPEAETGAEAEAPEMQVERVRLPDGRTLLLFTWAEPA